MAKLMNQGARRCVADSITGVVIKRQGRSVCLATRSQAPVEANGTRCKGIDGSACKLVK